MLGFKWHWGSKDGGAESHVYAYGLECKALFSVLVLKFEDGTRDAYHSHAFDAVSWVLGPGSLHEIALPPSPAVPRGALSTTTYYEPSWRPIHTARETLHRVRSIGRTWVLTLRGPWLDTWTEAVPSREGKYEPRTLTHGRRVMN